jgi:hypothetical protein
LDEETQQKDIKNFHDIHVSDDFWYEHIYEDAIQIASLFGLNIEKIYFSGFWSQGDGASYEGFYSYKKGSLKAVMDYAPEDTELHTIVQKITDIQKPVFYRYDAKMNVSGHYVHSNCMNVYIWNHEDSYNMINEQDEQELIQLFREYADWIYSRLEKEYEYLTDEKTIREWLQDSDYEFLQNGEIYNQERIEKMKIDCDFWLYR